MEKKVGILIKRSIVIAVAFIVAVVVAISMQNGKRNNDDYDVSSDEYKIAKLLEAREPNVIESNDDIDFKAFFLRDTDGDGYTEDMEEIDQQIDNADYMFVEVNVKSEGQLKNGKITINDSNFKWKTAFIANRVIKNNYMGYTNEIELNDLNNGTQVLLYGKIESKIGTNIHDYDKQSLVTLTGTFVDNEQNETELTKESNLTVHWNGTTSTVIPNSYLQTYNIENAISEEEFTANFSVSVNETKGQLLMNKQEVQMVIPELNGYAPNSVICTSGNVVQNYDDETRTLSLEREAEVDENGNITKSVSRYNTYSVKVVYPIEAYNTLGQESVLLNVDVSGKSYGYNSEKYGIQESSANKAVSLIYTKIVTSAPVVRDPNTWNFYTSIGTYSVKDGSYANRISKQNVQKIYDGNTYDDVTDIYPVCWTVSVGQKEKINKITLEQTSIDKFNGSINMEDYETTTGIYFSNVANALGENGKIEVYNLEDGLLETFTKDNWGTYTSENPYKVNTKGIKVVTSAPVSNTYFYVYQIKELDDDKIAEDFTQEEFNNLTRIYTYAKGTIDVVEGQTSNTVTVQNRTASALYDMPISRVSFSSYPNEIANHQTQNVTLTISASSSGIFESKWKDGTFLVKLPDDVINAELTNATISNSDVAIKSALVYKENEKYFVRIDTENETPATYSITLNLAINANPLEPTKNGTFILYASNKECEKYNTTANDTFDINSNGLTNDQVAYRTRSINLIASHGLITEEYISNYNDAGSITIAPNVAEIDRSDDARTATVNVSVANNYSEAVDEIKILGKVPFQGNTYILNDNNLGSEYTAHIKGSITVPTELQSHATIYYTENENPTKDLTDSNNGWTQTVTDWTKVKCYLIDLGSYELRNTGNKVFSYEVEVPSRTGYNKATFACHAVYYSLITEIGRYQTETQPTKVGLQVVQKYNLELTKNKQNYNNILVPGATYKVVTKDLNDKDVVKLATTGKVAPNEGKLTITGLYVGREYTVSEISTPDDYMLNTNEIKFNTSIQDVNNTEELRANVTSGSFNGVPEVTTDANDNYLVKAKVQDEAKYTLLINTQDEEDNTLTDVRYAITGKNQGKMYKDTNGQVKAVGLLLNEEYEIQLMRSIGYYTDEVARKFTIVRDETTHNLKIVTEDEELANAIIVEEIPGQSTVTLTIKTEKIPTYDLKILKIEEPANEDAEIQYLTGAQFKFTSDDTLETDVHTVENAEGIAIPGLYNYVENKNTISGKYTLQEIKAPEGYSNNAEEITFYVEKTNEGQTVHIENENSLRTIYSAEIEENTLKLIIQDKPLFKLTKEDSEQVDEQGNPILLPNAKFVIKELDSNRTPKDFAKDVNGNYVGEYDEETEQYIVTTDENGQITVPLRAGEYMIKEVGYPEGYFAESNVHVFKIIGEAEEDEIDDGIEDGSTKIKYIEDLVDLSRNVNSGTSYEGKSIKLTRTLDFNDSNSYRNASDTSYGDINGNNEVEDIKTELTTGAGFTPIGKSSLKLFQGKFDGQGYEIKNLYLNKTSNVDSYAGLFGFISNAEIKNLGVSGIISNNIGSSYQAYTGGIAGCVANSIISNCYNTGDVSCSGSSSYHVYAGGIAGYVTNSIISNSYNTGNISFSNRGNGYAGGIAGSLVYDKNTINNCYNTGNVSSNSDNTSYAGGITGNVTSGSIISNSYNIGNVSISNSGNSYAGGIAADVSYTSSIISNCYYWNEITITGRHISSAGKTKTEQEMKGENLLSLLGSLNWKKDENDVNNGFPVLRGEEDFSEIIEVNYIEDLVKISNLVNTGSTSYSGKTIRLMRTLDFNASNSYRNVTSTSYGDINGNNEIEDIKTELTMGTGFNPIGNSSLTSFQGTFDGQGYEIQNLYINITSNRTTFAGLFGYINNAEIKNVDVSGLVSASSTKRDANVYAGGISGYVDNSTISNCYNTGDVSSSSGNNVAYAGGIAGRVANSVISNSYSTGDVTCNSSSESSFAGGIAGYIDNNTISNCYNTGDVSSSSSNKSYAGGIVGYRYIGTISYCYYWNAITITGETINSDGIAKTEQEMKGADVLTLLGYAYRFDENNVNNGFPILGMNYFNDDNDIIEINYIEDLVELSFNVNGGEAYSKKSIKLIRNLDFSDNNLYRNITSKYYGDINGNNEIEDVKTELTTGTGFNPIGNSSSTSFQGTFDGQGYEIQNLYINIESNTNIFAGLFGYIDCATISNLAIYGKVNGFCIKTAFESSNVYVGGVVGYAENSNIINCCNISKVNGSNENTTNGSPGNYRICCSYVGGIAGGVRGSAISNCYNTGEVSGRSDNSGFNHCYCDLGGIAGFIADYGLIISCYNTGNIESSTTGPNNGSGTKTGGIGGEVYGNSTISNCYNTGNVISSSNGNAYVGGIAGYVNINNSTIINCYNTGDVSSNGNAYVGGIAGYVSSGKISNCYYLNTIEITGTTLNNRGINKTEEEMKQLSFVDLLSNLFWKLDEDNINNGFPLLKNYEGLEEKNGFIEINYIEDLVELSISTKLRNSIRRKNNKIDENFRL